MTAPALTTALATSLAYAPASEMAGFGMAASDLSYFADFEEVKKINKKTPLGETGCLCIFFGHSLMSPALHPGFSDL